MSEGSIRRRRRSSPEPAAPLPDDDDILREILLRLPPRPSSLPRASLVSKRWRRILSDPRFLRRFRAFHHQRAPLLGFFTFLGFGDLCFTPTLDPPDRIPSGRLSLSLPRGDSCDFLGCRRGLALMLNYTCHEITVWDPITGEQRCVALPPGFNRERMVIGSGAVLCDDHAGRAPLESFKVVLLWTDNVQLHAGLRASVILYESKTDVWSNIISTSIRAPFSSRRPSILVGNSLYWLLFGHGLECFCILKFDLDKKNLTAIDTPPDAQVSLQDQILRMEDSRLGYASMTGFFIIQVWDNKPDSERGWMLQKTIDLDKLLPLGTVGRAWIALQGYDEDGDAIFVSDNSRVFMIQLKSLQFKSLFETNNVITTYHPFRSFYIIGSSIGNGDLGAELLNNT